jgi:hypothetical protein
MSRYYDRGGNPISQEEWVRLLQTGPFEASRRVALTSTPSGPVSTVWLGLDHSFGDGPPLIFETLGPDDDMERYSTLEEAEEGHRRFVAKYGGVVSSVDCPACSEMAPFDLDDYICHTCRQRLDE